MERMERDKITKSVYLGVCCSCLLGKLQKRWIEGVFKEERFRSQASKENVAG